MERVHYESQNLLNLVNLLNSNFLKNATSSSPFFLKSAFNSRIVDLSLTTQTYMPFAACLLECDAYKDKIFHVLRCR